MVYLADRGFRCIAHDRRDMAVPVGLGEAMNWTRSESQPGVQAAGSIQSASV
jgi:hypothetical protein